MAKQLYISRCFWCQRTGSPTYGTSTGGAPLHPPANLGGGPCSKSPDKKHMLQWHLK